MRSGSPILVFATLAEQRSGLQKVMKWSERGDSRRQNWKRADPSPLRPVRTYTRWGRVIYYMLSGGGIVAREELDSPDYVATFAKGERYGLLRTLLFRMIAPLDRRIKVASEVREELRRIEKWEEHARSLALSPSALESIDAAQRKAADQVRIKAENERIRKSERDLVASVTANVLAWLKGELEKTAIVLEKAEPII